MNLKEEEKEKKKHKAILNPYYQLQKEQRGERGRAAILGFPPRPRSVVMGSYSQLLTSALLFLTAPVVGISAR